MDSIAPSEETTNYAVSIAELVARLHVLITNLYYLLNNQNAMPKSILANNAIGAALLLYGAPVEGAEFMMFDGQSQPNRWMLYDLEMPFGPLGQSESTDVSVARRTPVTACERTVAFVASCFVIGSNLKPIVTYLANVIIDARDQRSFGTFTGSTSGVTFRYQANGNNCDTTAEEETIKEPSHTTSVPLMVANCALPSAFDLTHGGTCDGYLLIGPTNGFDSSAYCGPKLTKDMFSKCSSGGKEDVPKEGDDSRDRMMALETGWVGTGDG